VKLRRWDIVFVPVDDQDTAGHPAVVLSLETRLDDARLERINVLVGSKRPPAEFVREHQVLLDRADGLDFATVVDCAFIYTVRKSAILRLAGSVGWTRRTELQRKVRAYLELG
jgi:hypothetical protein